MKSKIFYVINILLLVCLVAFFFFEIIPVPVENVLGSNLEDKYIFGGFYYTSLFSQLQFGNYFGAGTFVLSFVPLFIGNKLIFGKNGN